eukprot:14977101-Heterocapsa_arctica.AAC.1
MSKRFLARSAGPALSSRRREELGAAGRDAVMGLGEAQRDRRGFGRGRGGQRPATGWHRRPRRQEPGRGDARIRPDS